MTFETDPAPKRERSRYRTAGFLAAGGFLVVVVVLAIAVIFGSKGSTPATHPTSPSASAAVASDCHPTDTNQQLPQTNGPTAKWSLFKGVALPTSSSAGPMVIDGDVARCYAHTPAGALMAAEQIAIRHYLADDWRRVTLEQVAPGTGRDTYIRDQSGADVERPDGGYGQWAAYHFVTYTSDTAVIQLITRFFDGSMKMGTATVVWSGGDWRLQLQPDGQDTPTQQTLTSLDGFVPWEGV